MATTSPTATELATVVIRFAGDSGDGMQVTGAQLASASAYLGNDVHTFADFPAEIRAPAGTIPGVSGFQVSFSEQNIHTPGDRLDVLIAMNPAALKVNLADLREGGILLLNSDHFKEKDCKKAGLTNNPLETGELAAMQVYSLPLTELTLNAVKATGVTHAQASRCKNFFALGIILWLYTRPMEPILTWLSGKFKATPAIANANTLALKAGYNYALTCELFANPYTVKKAILPPGYYRHVTGNEALSLGCLAVASKAQQPMLVAGYPITPASAILQQLAKYPHYQVTVFQAEDEIAAVCAAIGAAYGGSMALTTTSGPGFDLKAEGMGLAVMTELPLVVIDVQRAGPSTGMPTKTEQADLLTAVYGRHGECPLPVLAAASPGDCFHMIIEAFRLAIRYMTPVVLLTDAYLATSAEPWLLPDLAALPDLRPCFAKENVYPYQRDPDTLARPWIIPGTAGLEHRIGGLEKDSLTGNISYGPENHQRMVELRAAKVKGIAKDLPPLQVLGGGSGQLLVVGWGSTQGSILQAVEQLQAAGAAVSYVHLRYLNPLPLDLGDILNRFNKIWVPELNLGQLSCLLRAEYGVNVISYSKVTGKPFLVQELCEEIKGHL